MALVPSVDGIEATAEKLLVFSFSPIILYCVYLVWALLPLHHNHTLVTLSHDFHYLDSWGISIGSARAADPQDRTSAFEEFQKADKPRVLTGTHGVMGKGAALVCAFRCILLDPDREISREDQAIARTHPSGQRHPTARHEVYSEQSFDERGIAY